MSWTGNGSFYSVYRGTTSGGPYTNILNATTNLAYQDGAVQNGRTYFYVVTALNILGEESPYSPEMIARPAATTVVPIIFASSANHLHLQLNWPADHIGWRLMMQTNHLSSGVSLLTNDWTMISNSAGTNQIILPIDPARTSEFYRLIYP